MLNAYQPPNKTPNKAVFFKSFEISIDPAAALTVDDALETVVFPRFCFSLNNDTALLLLEDNEVELEKEEVGNRIVPLDEVIVIEETAAATGVRTHRLEDAAVVVVLRVVARMFTACAESVWVVANISFYLLCMAKIWGKFYPLFCPTLTHVFSRNTRTCSKRRRRTHTLLLHSQQQIIIIAPVVLVFVR